MKGNPWKELLIVLLLVGGGIAMILALPRGMSGGTAVSAPATSATVAGSEDLSLELRSVHEVESLKLEYLQQGDEWVTVLKEDKPSLKTWFATVNLPKLDKEREWRVSVVWPESAGESVLEFKLSRGESPATLWNVWGQGETVESIMQPSAAEAHAAVCTDPTHDHSAHEGHDHEGHDHKEHDHKEHDHAH